MDDLGVLDKLKLPTQQSSRKIEAGPAGYTRALNAEARLEWNEFFRV